MTNQEIAAVLWKKCVDARFHPGKTEFTKYLYLIDYCHWKLTGKKITDIKWKFHLYGPWDCTIDQLYEASPRLKPSYEIPEILDRILTQIVIQVKTVSFRALLDFVYFDTEPMQHAKRGETLNFQSIPIDHTMPALTPVITPATDCTISPAKLASMERTRQKYLARRADYQAKEERIAAYMQSDDYALAMKLLDEDLHGTAEPLPKMTVTITPDALIGLQSIGDNE